VKLLPCTRATLAALVLFSARAALASPASEAAFAEGQALMSAKQFAEAAQKYEIAVGADPKFATAWYSLAVARRHLNQCPGAIAAYRRYAALAPDEAEPYFGLGLCLRDTGDKAGAIEALKHYILIEKRPASERWVDKAHSVLAELGAPGSAPIEKPAAPAEKPAAASAKAGLKSSAAASPASPASPTSPTAPASPTSPATPAYVEAQSLRDHGHIDEAIAKFHQAIAADPRHLAARAALGELLLKIRRDDEAIVVFGAALDKNPGYALAWYDLAFALRARGRSVEAVDAYEHYIKLRPTDPDPYYGLARALQRLGRKVDSRKAYETYLTMEKRPSEKRWVESAQTQLQQLASTP
jgi:tetratricopeptide (TPR) repeat protein